MPDDDKSVAGHADFFENIKGDSIVRISTTLGGNHPHLPLIGRVASEWTHFENILDEIIIELSEIPEEIALCITRQIMGATPRFKMIESLGNLKEVDTDLLRKARKLKSDQYETGEQRNRIVHDPWLVVQEAGRRNEAPETTQLNTAGYTPVPESEIIKTIDSIKDLIRRAAELQIEFRARPRTSR
jgi:hypothetical protein